MTGILRKKCFFIWCVETSDQKLIPVNPDHLEGIGLISGEEINGTISDNPFPIKTQPNETTQELILVTDKSFVPLPNLVIEK
jgi:hypothetical protein